MRRVGTWILVGVLGAPAASAAGSAATTAGWSQWGGPDRDFTLPAEGHEIGWAEGSPRLLWQRLLGPGYSAIVGDGERLFTMTRRDGHEVVLALAGDTGETVWEHAYPAPLPDEGRPDTTWGEGPNGTPLLVAGRLYTLGFTGVLSCLDAATGAPVWRHDLAAEMGVRVPFFGHSASPLRHGDLVIVAGGAAGVLAFRLADGELVWRADGFAGSYASPAPWEGPAGVQLVVPGAGEVVGLDPRDGAILWRHEHANSQRTILSGAVFADERVMFVSAYFLGSIALELAEDGASVTELWETPSLQLSLFNSIRVGDTLYGFHNSILTALDLASGEIVWRSREFDRGHMVRVGDRFLLLDRHGKLHLLTLGPDGAATQAAAQLLEGRSWTAPTLIGSRLYARNLESIVAVDLAGPGGAPPPARVAGPVRPARELPAAFTDAAIELVRAYRAGDVAGLESAAARLERWAGDESAGALTSYYLGLAAYQRALLAGDAALPALREAERHLTAATGKDPGMVDAHLLLSRLYPMYYRFDRGRASIVGMMGDEHLATAVRLAPDDPRVMAMQGLDLIYSPPQYGGDPPAGMALMRRALDGFAAPGAEGPYPNWGVASVWAWYARALLAADPPDRAAAEAALGRALELAPDLALARRLLEGGEG